MNMSYAITPLQLLFPIYVHCMEWTSVFWASDVSAMTGVENSTYDIEGERLELKRLVRLDMGEEFFYRE